jgi:hypothetical protein
MYKYKEIIRLRFVALMLLALFLTGCFGGGAKETAAPIESATTSKQAEPVATTEVLATNTPLAEEAFTATPEPVVEKAPTETPSPTEAPPTLSPTNTLEIAPTNTEAVTSSGDVYEPIPGCAKSRLHWGDTIRISQAIEYVRIRSTADTHPADNVVRRLYRSELAKTIGLPVCNYGWILWPIQTADGTRGWVPESNGTDFWLVNYNDYFFPSATPVSR